MIRPRVGKLVQDMSRELTIPRKLIGRPFDLRLEKCDNLSSSIAYKIILHLNRSLLLSALRTLPKLCLLSIPREIEKS